MMISRQQQTLLLLVAALATVLFLQGNAFVIQPQTSRYSSRLFETVQAPSSMQASDIRNELESYGISTKSFLEKKDLVEALEKARAEGKTPKKNVKSSSSSSSSDVNGEKESSSASRQEKLDKELNKAKSMKVGELKKALEDMGISTKSFFEKTEFVKAYAEAIVDGPPKQKAGTRARPQTQEYDPSYRDVVMRKLDQRELNRGPVIDIRLGR
jgi:uncharacterized protein with GYD domain